MDGAGVDTAACMHRCTQWGLVRRLHAAGASAQMLPLCALRAARGMHLAMASAACLVSLLPAPVSLGWTGFDLHTALHKWLPSIFPMPGWASSRSTASAQAAPLRWGAWS